MLKGILLISLLQQDLNRIHQGKNREGDSALHEHEGEGETVVMGLQ